MSEPTNNNFDPNDDMTALDRVRKQIDRVLSRNGPPNPEREKQVELRAEVERLLAEHNRSSSLTSNEQKDDDRSIILRLIEIKGLLERQENIYREQERARERRNRAISEYIVLVFVWVMGAFTMFIWLRV